MSLSNKVLNYSKNIIVYDRVFKSFFFLTYKNCFNKNLRNLNNYCSKNFFFKISV